MTERASVAGLDAGLVRLDEADRLAGRLATLAAARGVVGDRLLVGIHRVVETGSDPSGRLAFSIAVDEAEPEATWQLVSGLAESLSAGERPLRIAVVLGRRCDGDAAHVPAARAAAREREAGTGGRAASFPGCDRLVGPCTVEEIVSGSAIDHVVDLSGSDPAPDDLVLVGERLRPRWQFGSLALHVVSAPGSAEAGVYLPFDRPGSSSGADRRGVDALAVDAGP